MKIRQHQPAPSCAAYLPKTATKNTAATGSMPIFSSAAIVLLSKAFQMKDTDLILIFIY